MTLIDGGLEHVRLLLLKMSQSLSTITSLESKQFFCQLVSADESIRATKLLIREAVERLATLAAWDWCLLFQVGTPLSDGWLGVVRSAMRLVQATVSSTVESHWSNRQSSDHTVTDWTPAKSAAVQSLLHLFEIFVGFVTIALQQAPTPSNMRTHSAIPKTLLAPIAEDVALLTILSALSAAKHDWRLATQAVRVGGAVLYLMALSEAAAVALGGQHMCATWPRRVCAVLHRASDPDLLRQPMYMQEYMKLIKPYLVACPLLAQAVTAEEAASSAAAAARSTSSGPAQTAAATARPAVPAAAPVSAHVWRTLLSVPEFGDVLLAACTHDNAHQINAIDAAVSWCSVHVAARRMPSSEDSSSLASLVPPRLSAQHIQRLLQAPGPHRQLKALQVADLMRWSIWDIVSLLEAVWALLDASEQKRAFYELATFALTLLRAVVPGSVEPGAAATAAAARAAATAAAAAPATVAQRQPAGPFGSQWDKAASVMSLGDSHLITNVEAALRLLKGCVQPVGDHQMSAAQQSTEHWLPLKSRAVWAARSGVLEICEALLRSGPGGKRLGAEGLSIVAPLAHSLSHSVAVQLQDHLSVQRAYQSVIATARKVLLLHLPAATASQGHSLQVAAELVSMCSRMVRAPGENGYQVDGCNQQNVAAVHGFHLHLLQLLPACVSYCRAAHQRAMQALARGDRALLADFMLAFAPVLLTVISSHGWGLAAATAAAGAPELAALALHAACHNIDPSPNGRRLRHDVMNFARLAFVGAGQDRSWAVQEARLGLMTMIEEIGNCRGVADLTTQRDEIMLAETLVSAFGAAWILEPDGSNDGDSGGDPSSAAAALAPSLAADLDHRKLTAASVATDAAGVVASPVPLCTFFGCWYGSCTNLDGASEATLRLRMCGGCRLARYCSVACQQRAWVSGHRAACSSWQEQHSGPKQ